MTYKTLRNKAFRDGYKLVKSNYESEVWSGTPYAMLKGDWLSDYKARKDQLTLEVPDLAPVISLAIGYIPVEQTRIEMDVDGMDLVKLKHKEREATVQKRFFDLVRAIYPDSTVRLANGESHKFSPVRFYDNHKLVAVVMPLAT